MSLKTFKNNGKNISEKYCKTELGGSLLYNHLVFMSAAETNF